MCACVSEREPNEIERNYPMKTQRFSMQAEGAKKRDFVKYFAIQVRYLINTKTTPSREENLRFCLPLG